MNQLPQIYQVFTLSISRTVQFLQQVFSWLQQTRTSPGSHIRTSCLEQVIRLCPLRQILCFPLYQNWIAGWLFPSTISSRFGSILFQHVDELLHFQRSLRPPAVTIFIPKYFSSFDDHRINRTYRKDYLFIKTALCF